MESQINLTNLIIIKPTWLPLGPSRKVTVEGKSETDGTRTLLLLIESLLSGDGLVKS